MTIYKYFWIVILSEGKKSVPKREGRYMIDGEGLLQLIVVACDCMWPQSVIGFASPFCSGGLFWKGEKY